MNTRSLWIVLAFVLALFVAGKAKAEQTVLPGQVIETEAAILCADVESAKTLADTVGEEQIQKVGTELIANGKCGIAAGRMQVVAFVYSGKTYNVFRTHDTRFEFFWVTVVKPLSV